MSFGPGTTASTRVDGDEIVVGEQRVGVGAERPGERLELLGLDRQPRRGPVPAEALEVLGAGAEARVQVEGADRPARALPVALGARDQHDRPVVPLDEARGDDADDALVPVGAGDDVPLQAGAAPRATTRSP